MSIWIHSWCLARIRSLQGSCVNNDYKRLVRCLGTYLMAFTRIESNSSQYKYRYESDVDAVLEMAPFVKVFLIALTTQALVTGVYLASFLLCLRWFVFSDDGEKIRKGITWHLLIITIVLFALSLGEFGIFFAFDSVFRCWIVYNRSWRIAVLPFLLLLYNISSLFMLTRWNFGIHLVTTESPAIPVEGITASYYASTTVINIYATSAIIWQIWRNSFSRRLTRFVVRVVAESGLLYTLVSIATCCGVFLGPNRWLVVMIQINYLTAGVAYNLIMIRVAQNRARPEVEPLPTSTGVSAIEHAILTAPRHSLETVGSS
ncbi:hypothetical protein F5887DRAFT_976910 [Amanita rubescens]|nr:hypothetical protein F5887DRAFT_976910 [Amanita rubescens]